VNCKQCDSGCCRRKGKGGSRKRMERKKTKGDLRKRRRGGIRKENKRKEERRNI
jgi:hypothetical protein